MNILPLCGKLSLDICDFERRKRMWQTGLAQAMRLSPPSNDIRKIIETRLLEPVVRELGRKPDKTSGTGCSPGTPASICYAREGNSPSYPFPILPPAECSSNT
ncbi:hypothetical protein ACIXMN_12360 [Bacteroides fragilis]